MVLSVWLSLQRKEAQPQPTVHSRHFRRAYEIFYYSHRGLVADLLLLLLMVAGLCTAQMKAAFSPGPQRQTPTSLTQGLPKYIP